MRMDCPLLMIVNNLHGLERFLLILLLQPEMFQELLALILICGAALSLFFTLRRPKNSCGNCKK
ncbi:MAG: hypothetical protein N2050_08260 [Flavobacteriales bacterium]|nr:hypothetical protein [Flavobacteriales bacterium]